MIHKRKIDKFDFIKGKASCFLIDTLKRKIKQHTDLEKIFAYYISDKGLVIRMCKKQ